MGLDATEYILELEQTFEIKIPDEAVQQMRTIGDTCDYVVAHADPGRWSPAQVELKVREIAVPIFGLPPHRITRESRYVEDLGA